MQLSWTAHRVGRTPVGGKMDDPFKLDFVGIGAARCGTSWITTCLCAHPQICLSSKKEMRYFNARHHMQDIPNENHTKPFSWYVSHFEHCLPKQVKGEFSPPYLWDEAAPPLIKKHFPEVKLLVSLRNPIDRAYSAHLKRTFHKVEKRPFEQAVAELSAPVKNGFYAQLLSRYFDLFRRDQILVVFFEQITADPADGLKRVFEFLGVDPKVSIPAATMRTKVNAMQSPRRDQKLKRMSLLERIARHPRLSPIRSACGKIDPRKGPEETSDAPWNYPPMKPETREYLFNLYRNDVHCLEQMLSCDLSHWR